MIFNRPLATTRDEMISSIPEATASSTNTPPAYRRPATSLGLALVAGKKRVPKPATGRMAFLIFLG
jgi:hypothetical protein